MLLAHFAEEKVSEANSAADIASAERGHQSPRFRDGVSFSSGRLQVMGIDLLQAARRVARSEPITGPQHRSDN